MDFGLGLVLSFTDNASAGMQNAVNTLNQLTETASNATNSLQGMAQLGAFSVVADQVGTSFLKAGTGIMGMFTNLLGKVQQTGSDFESFRITLNALYQDEKKAEEQIGKLLDFSIKSPFEVNDVKDMLVVLQSQGIDAFEQMTGAINGTRQESLAWLADLMAFKPDIPVSRWKLAITNFLGSGVPKVLENALDMGKIADIIGHSIGDTAEERMQSLVELVDMKNLNGLADSMSASWAGVASNIDDAWTKLYMSIADNGVFESLKNSFMGVAGAVMSLDNEQIAALGKTIAEGLNIIVTPLSKAAEKVNGLITKLVELCQTNPQLVKMGMVAVAIAGGLIMFAGVALKLGSMLGMLTIGLRTFGDTFSIVSGALRTGALRVLGALIPLTLTLGLIYLSWKNDLGGIRTLLTNFVVNIRTAFSEARRAANLNVQGMMSVVDQLQSKGDFWSNFTAGLIKAKTLWDILADAWSDGTISEELYDKMVSLGLKPIVEAILDLKFRWDNFVIGFKEGVDKAWTSMLGFIDNLTSRADGTIFETLIEGATTFINMLNENDPQVWQDMGRNIGEVATYLGVAATALTAFNILFNPIGKIVGLFRTLSTVLGLVTAHPIIAVIVGIVAALGILYTQSEGFRNLVSELIGLFTQMGNELIMSLIPYASQVIDAFNEFGPAMMESFGRIGEAIGPILSQLKELGMGIIPIIGDVVGSVISTVVSLMPTIMSIITTIANILATVFEIVGKLMAVVVPFILDIGNQLGGLIGDVLPIIADLIANVSDAVTSLINMCLPMVQRIIESLMPIIHTIFNIVSMIMSRLIPVIKMVMTIVSQVIQAIIAIIFPIITVIMQVVDAIIQVLAPIVDLILQAVGFIIDVILGIVQIVMSVVTSIITIVTGIIEVIMSIVNIVVQIFMMMFSSIVGLVTLAIDIVCTIISSIIGIVQVIWDFFINAFTNIVTFITDVFRTIFDVVADVFNNIADFFTKVWNDIVDTFATLGDTISGVIKGAINMVVGGAVNIINGFIKAINFALDVINAIPGVSISRLETLVVPKLATGGVVDSPTTAIIGEAGKEAVIPLERNTGWMKDLAFILTSTIMEGISFIPKGNGGVTNNNTSNTSKDSYMTSNTVNNTKQGSVDNSITFNAGAIQINCQNASEEEAVRMAKKIMEYITRQKQLDKMLAYG